MSDEYTLIRNATAVLEYGGKRFLIDPMLADKGAYPGFAGSARSELRNPLVDLPMPIEDVLRGIDEVILTHLHPDHWDEAAVAKIPKDLPLVAQNDADAATLASQGFHKVRVMQDKGTDLGNGITLHKTRCQHGSDALYAVPAMAERLGSVTGLVFQHAGSKTLYCVADTIWFSGVEEAMRAYKPQIVVLNGGYATLDEFGPIIMGKEDIPRFLDIDADVTIVVQHLEAVNHCVLSRQELSEYVAKKGVASRVFIPADGETVPL